MTVQNITLMGHPTLMTPAKPVADPADPAIAGLIADMKDTMAAAGGIGIAAPQIGVALRVVMFHAPPDSEPAQNTGSDSTDPELRAGIQDQPLVVLINPEIEVLDGPTADGWEGCLSVPGLRGLVPRPQRIRYQGLTPSGQLYQREASGFHAVVVQHECDHLDGILYPMRIKDMSTLQYVGAADGGTYRPADTVEEAAE